MNRKLPSDAFDFYFALGPSRSYQAVATRYGSSKRAVTRLAVREDWQGRIARCEREARERSNTKAIETLEAMQEKHLKALQFVLGKAIDALRAQPLETAMEAVRSIEMVIRQERLVRGEPTDRAVVNVEELVKREYRDLMVEEVVPGNGRVEAEEPEVERSGQEAQ